MDKCQICGVNQSEETHHIEEQHNANNYGIIGDIHKNRLSNLIALCKKCHCKITHDNLLVSSKIMTTDGPINNITTVKKKKKKKYSIEECTEIKNLFEHNSNINNLLLIVKDKLNRNISRSTLGKIIKDIY